MWKWSMPNLFMGKRLIDQKSRNLSENPRGKMSHGNFSASQMQRVMVPIYDNLMIANTQSKVLFGE